MAQGGELQHRDIEAPSIESDQGTGEAFGAGPEFTHQGFFRVIAEGKSLDRIEYVVVINVSDRDRDRKMQGDRKKVAVAAPPQVFAIAIESLAIAEPLTIEVNLV